MRMISYARIRVIRLNRLPQYHHFMIILKSLKPLKMSKGKMSLVGFKPVTLEFKVQCLKTVKFHNHFQHIQYTIVHHTHIILFSVETIISNGYALCLESLGCWFKSSSVKLGQTWWNLDKQLCCVSIIIPNRKRYAHRNLSPTFL